MRRTKGQKTNKQRIILIIYKTNQQAHGQKINVKKEDDNIYAK